MAGNAPPSLYQAPVIRGSLAIKPDGPPKMKGGQRPLRAVKFFLDAQFLLFQLLDHGGIWRGAAHFLADFLFKMLMLYLQRLCIRCFH